MISTRTLTTLTAWTLFLAVAIQAEPFAPSATFPFMHHYHPPQEENSSTKLRRGAALAKKVSGETIKTYDDEDATTSSPPPFTTTAGLVKIHGYMTLIFTTIHALESFAVVLPFGPTESYTDFRVTSPPMKAVVRMASSFALFLGLTEIQLHDNAKVQNIFRIYQTPLILTLMALAESSAFGIVGWLLPGVAGAFGVLTWVLYAMGR